MLCLHYYSSIKRYALKVKNLKGSAKVQGKGSAKVQGNKEITRFISACMSRSSSTWAIFSCKRSSISWRYSSRFRSSDSRISTSWRKRVLSFSRHNERDLIQMFSFISAWTSQWQALSIDPISKSMLDSSEKLTLLMGSWLFFLFVLTIRHRRLSTLCFHKDYTDLCLVF